MTKTRVMRTVAILLSLAIALANFHPHSEVAGGVLFDSREMTVGPALLKPPAQPLLWRDPVDIKTRNLLAGIGGPDAAPNPTHRFTFLSGSDPVSGEKVVQDEAGRIWLLITGLKARADVSASRLLWAAGFHTDQTYYLPSIHIDGNGGGNFTEVRLKRRDDGYIKTASWSWSANPFVENRELQGLRTLMALLSVWDLSKKRNAIARRGEETNFYVSQLQTALGKSADLASNSTVANPRHYAEQKFIDKVKDAKVFFHLKGDHTSVVRNVTVENARWIGEVLGQLSDQQIADAFRAGGFSASDIAVYQAAVKKRISDLRNLT